MKILVANLGSTSFKFGLLDMSSETQLARGSIDRIGSTSSSCLVQAGGRQRHSTVNASDHAAATEICLDQLSAHGCLRDRSELAGIGLKAVHGGRLSGVHQVDADVMDAMQQVADVAPAHNPVYLKAMKLLTAKFPDTPLVAAFETGFHRTVPPAQHLYAVPAEWARQYHVQKWGFHGASHQYIAQRMSQLCPQARRVISCHLGGSSSLCAIRDGCSAGTTMGMSPQTGVPQGNRCGDFDPFSLPHLMRQTGKSLTELLEVLASRSGLLGLSGISGDVRDLQTAASQGNHDAQLALDVFVSEIRRHLGGLLVLLGGCECIVFTGGVGENSSWIRQSICHGLQELGIVLDMAANDVVAGESAISPAGSRVSIWVVPTNEELIVARHTANLLRE